MKNYINGGPYGVQREKIIAYFKELKSFIKENSKSLEKNLPIVEEN